MGKNRARQAEQRPEIAISVVWSRTGTVSHAAIFGIFSVLV